MKSPVLKGHLPASTGLLTQQLALTAFASYCQSVRSRNLLTGNLGRSMLSWRLVEYYGKR